MHRTWQAFKRRDGGDPFLADRRQAQGDAIGPDSDRPVLAFWVATVKPQDFDRDLAELDRSRRGSRFAGGRRQTRRGSRRRTRASKGFIKGRRCSGRRRGRAGSWTASPRLSWRRLCLRALELERVAHRFPHARVAWSIFGRHQRESRSDLIVPGQDDRIIYTGEGRPAGRLMASPPGARRVAGHCSKRADRAPSADCVLLSRRRGPCRNARAPGPGKSAIKGRNTSRPRFLRHRGRGSLLSVHAIDEMVNHDRHDLFNRTDFTIEKRFHLVPQASLLITIPNS